jgi:hypothetical protein
MRVTEMVLQERPPVRPRVHYERVFTWLPLKTQDDGWVCLCHVWRITCGPEVFHTRSVIAW